jgi:hypothetical protein
MKKNVQKRKQKRKKNTWGKLQCFKEKDKKTKFSTSSIVKKKKINKNNSEKNKRKKKKICKK